MRALGKICWAEEPFSTTKVVLNSIPTAHSQNLEPDYEQNVHFRKSCRGSLKYLSAMLAASLGARPLSEALLLN